MPGSADGAEPRPTPPGTGGRKRRPLLVWVLAAVFLPLLLTVAAAVVSDLRSADADDAVPGPAAVPSATPTPSSPSATEPVPVEPAAVQPFRLTRTDESLGVRAVVQHQTAKDAIVHGARRLIDDGGAFDDQISVDPEAGRLDPGAVTALLQSIAGATGTASVEYDGQTVTLTGVLPDRATKATAARAAAKAVPGAVVADRTRIPVPPKPKVSEACRTFAGRVNALPPIAFLSGTAIVAERSEPLLPRAARVLKSCPAELAEIGGHTDNLGDPATSGPLSERRAETVKAALVRLGVAPERLSARGYGEARPLESNTTAAGRIANRRAEIRVVEGR